MDQSKVQDEPDVLWIKAGVPCWIEVENNEEVLFEEGEIISFNESTQMALVQNNEKDEFEISPLKIQERNQLYENCNDMIHLPILNNAELLRNIQMRFKNSKIYTFIGPTLISLNPYVYIEDQTGQIQLENFQQFLKTNNSSDALSEMEPSIFAVSSNIWIQLKNHKKNQAMVISGESGSGKTENAKFTMKFLATLNKNPDSQNKVSIEDQILKCNPILEAFGNAKTVRNDNSSRFGKYVTLLVEKSNHKILGAQTLNYLLEKSRIISQAKQERNYHIFYHFLYGASTKKLESVGLADKNTRKIPENFNYLNSSECHQVNSVNDQNLYKEVKQAFRDLKFNEQQFNLVWKIVASTLLIGNIEFDEKTLTNDHPCTIKNLDICQKVSELISIPSAMLQKAFLFKTRKIAGEEINSPLNLSQCIVSRDAFAKELYSNLFTWLVICLNNILLPEQFQKKSQTEIAKVCHTMGILDIFGFECFDANFFEQFFINFTNEKLQQVYINYVFTAEKQEYQKEGLSKYIQDINYKDNQSIVDLLEKPPNGIFIILDEQCSLNSNDDKLLNQFKQKNAKDPHFLYNFKKKDEFVIKHTAKDVSYHITNFLGKNKDELSTTIIEAFNTSENKDLKQMFQQDKVGGQQSKLLGQKFRTQMNQLMDELNRCECHFVRCIKPNEYKQALGFQPLLCLQQIQYMGVLDTIKVRKLSYPYRFTFKRFVQKYKEVDTKLKLFSELVKENANFEEIAKDLIKKFFKNVQDNLLLIGKTKVFLKIDGALQVEKIYTEIMKDKNQKCAKIQKQWRHDKRRRVWIGFYQEMRRRVTGPIKTIQRKQKIMKIRNYFKYTKKQCIRIQRW